MDELTEYYLHRVKNDKPISTGKGENTNVEINGVSVQVIIWGGFRFLISEVQLQGNRIEFLRKSSQFACVMPKKQTESRFGDV